MSRFVFYHNGEQPYINMNLGGEEVSATWENSMLYTHGHDQHVDHLYIELDSIKRIGAFVWRQVMPDFNDLVRGLIGHDYPHLHMPYPSEHDVATYRSSGLIVPGIPKPVKIIEEVEDEEVVQEAIKNLDKELEYYLNEDS